MAQQGPDPIEVYQGAVQAIVPTIAAINSSQLSASTPCTQWTVQNLIKHNINTQTYLHGVLTSNPMNLGDMFQVEGLLPQEGGEAALKAITDSVISAAHAMDLSTIVTTPFGDMPAGNFIMIPMFDMVIHRWDLASATNQNNVIDSAVLGVLSPEAVAGGRQMGASSDPKS
jgi:uncharacterized protein (TIGR03086 family)